MYLGNDMENWFLNQYEKYLKAKNFFSYHSHWNVSNLIQKKNYFFPTNKEIFYLTIIMFWDNYLFSSISEQEKKIIDELYQDGYDNYKYYNIQKKYHISDLDKYLENIFIKLYTAYTKIKGGIIINEKCRNR